MKSHFLFLLLTIGLASNLFSMNSNTTNSELYPTIAGLLNEVKNNFKNIPTERKLELEKLSAYIKKGKISGAAIQLNFICTHNSRRSHIAQIFAQAAAAYYGIEQIACYSGGTETTAFNPNAIKALVDLGFRIDKTTEQKNPIYEVYYGANAPKIIAFSKKYSDAPNPINAYAAILTCSQADASCPIVVGADARIKLPYEDPKLADGTPQQEMVYKERCKQIATEMMYVFSIVK
jgi:arsenate reductase (thioredoxin)